MAVTIYGKTSSDYWTFKIVVTESEVNVDNNTSNLSVEAYIGRESSAGSSYMQGADINSTVSVTGCTDSTMEWLINNKFTFEAGGWKYIGTAYFIVPHNADGTKTVTVNASFKNNVSPLSGSANGSVKLTDISRATQPKIYTSFIEMGKNITIDLPRANSYFAHVLRYEFGSAKGYISGYAEERVDWVIPLDLANSIPNSTSDTLYIYCDTYSGGTFIGTKSVNLTIYVPHNIIPTVSIATTDPTGYKDKYGAFIQGHSKFKTNVTASGVYGSTIKSYKVQADGKTYTSVPVISEVITSSEMLLEIKATVTDSRNRASAVSGNIPILPYTAPKISFLSAYRCNEAGEKVNSGEYLAVVFSGAITGLNKLNSAEYVVKYKKNTDTEYTTHVLTDYSGKLTVEKGVFIFAADTSSSYDIVLTVSDDFLSVEKSVTGSSIKKLWSFLKKGFGFAFGKIAELENTIEFALDALFHNKANFLQGLQIKGTDLDYIVEQGEKDGWFYRKWDSGIAECWKIYYGTGINAAHVQYNGFYYSTRISVTYPFEFTNLPTLTVDGGSNANMNFVRVFGQSEEAATFVVVGLENVTSAEITVDIKAIGKWK